MEQNTKAYEQVRTLTNLLNQYRHEYYNLSAPVSATRNTTGSLMNWLLWKSKRASS